MLYRILQHTPDWKDTKNWRRLPNLHELADYLIDQVEEVHKNAEWRFRYDNDGNLRFRAYTVPGKFDKTHCVPLEWIPGLQVDLGGLYDLLLKTIGVVANAWSMDVVYNDYNGSVIDDTESYLGGEDGDEDTLLQLHVRAYKKGGPAYDLREQLLEYGEVKVEEIRHAMWKYRNVRGPLQKQVRQWIFLGLKAAQYTYDIKDFYFEEALENYDEIEPINASDMFGFMWSFHDKVHMHQEGLYDTCAQSGAPVVGPMICTEYFPNRPPKASVNIEHLAALSDFMNFGRKIYFDRYDKSLERFYNLQNSGNTHLLINCL